MKILLTGANGQVGWELARTLPALGELVALDRGQLDLSDAAALRRVIREVRPQLIVNAAAYTAVDQAESEPELARRVNVDAPQVMAEALLGWSGLLVHYSTDYVFDGTKPGAYTEDDPPNPINAYGASKLEGELAIQRSGVNYAIFRTSWVYAARGRNFLLTMLRLFEQRSELKIVDDQIGAPTWSRWLAQQTVAALRARERHATEQTTADWNGVFHLTAAGATSWYGFASAIRTNRYGEGRDAGPRLVPIPTRDYPTPARRPVNSVLSNAKAKSRFGLTQDDWAASLRGCMAELAATSPLR